ncbi:hypothetical protein D9M72_458370 [compost metagenome]
MLAQQRPLRGVLAVASGRGGLFQPAADQQADRDHQDADQEGQAPAPRFQVGRRQHVAQHQAGDRAQQRCQALAERLPGGIEAARAVIGVFQQQRGGGAHLAADGEALHQPRDHHHDRREDADLRVRRRDHEDQRAQAHQPQRQRHRRLAPGAVGVHADQQAAQRSHQEADAKGGERHQQLAGGIVDGEVEPADQRGKEAVDHEIVELEAIADGDGGNGARARQGWGVGAGLSAGYTIVGGRSDIGGHADCLPVRLGVISLFAPLSHASGRGERTSGA